MFYWFQLGQLDAPSTQPLCQNIPIRSRQIA
jgi:hypothetical protein